MEYVKGGGGNACTRTRRQAPLTPCSYLWVPHGRPDSTEMQAHARHPMDQGGRGGYNPNALHQGSRPRAHSPGTCRTADLVTAWSGPGWSKRRSELSRITRCRAAALAGTVSSGASIVAVDTA